jgi:hypothetical protein
MLLAKAIQYRIGGRMRYLIFPSLSGAIYRSLLSSCFLNLDLKNKIRRACGNVGKSCRFLAGLFQALRHFHQAGYSALVIPTDFAEDPKTICFSAIYDPLRCIK